MTDELIPCPECGTPLVFGHHEMDWNVGNGTVLFVNTPGWKCPNHDIMRVNQWHLAILEWLSPYVRAGERIDFRGAFGWWSEWAEEHLSECFKTGEATINCPNCGSDALFCPGYYDWCVENLPQDQCA
jgi:hypothetical protein